MNAPSTYGSCTISQFKPLNLRHVALFDFQRCREQASCELISLRNLANGEKRRSPAHRVHADRDRAHVASERACRRAPARDMLAGASVPRAVELETSERHHHVVASLLLFMPALGTAIDAYHDFRVSIA